LTNYKADLDAADIRILKTLGERGYLKNVELADAVGLSPSACHQRMARLKKLKIIKGFSVKIDISKIMPSIRVLTLLMLEDQHKSELDRMNVRLRKFPQIIRAYRISGEFNYAIETVAPDYDTFRVILKRLIDNFHVKQHQSRIMQETIKTENVTEIIDDD